MKKYIQPENYRVGLIGTGFIADLHMEVLKGMKGLEVIGCCDVNKLRAESFQKRWGVKNVYENIRTFIENESPDVLHILVPPDWHYQVANDVIEQGVNVFVEKPMTPASSECNLLVETARQKNVQIGINHNFLFFPLFQRLKKDLAASIIGRPQYVIAFYGGPLGQLDFGKYGHWMFNQPGNILLESAVHPLSQIIDILGNVESISGKATNRRELGKEQFFYEKWEAMLTCDKGSAFIHLASGAQYSPQRMVCVYGQDGVIIVDLLNNCYLKQPKSIFPDYFDPTARALRYMAPALEGLKNFSDYALAKVKLKGRSDTFFLSMKNSIENFYAALRAGQKPPSNGEKGFHVIQACEKWIESAGVPDNLPPQKINTDSCSSDNAEIFLTGATGFLGKTLVERLSSEGRKVRILVRSPNGLPASFHSPYVQVLVGDITDKSILNDAVAGVKTVFHLAHALGKSWDDFEKLNIIPTINLAQACIDNKVQQFIFTSTIAAFYYGDLPKTSDGLADVNLDSPIDNKPQLRNHYARSKILLEEKLIELMEKGLPLTIVRPGIVVGKGGMLAHSGVGQWSRDNVCAYWGRGENPLPFVLVEDVADALVAMFDRQDLTVRSFNLVGDVRINAREYIAELNTLSDRSIKAFAYPTWLCYTSEALKYVIKRVAGDKGGLLSYRDLANRSALADFDCQREKEILGWTPCDDHREFINHAIGWAFNNDSK